MSDLIKLLEPLLRCLGFPVDLLSSGEVSYLVYLCLFYFIASSFVLLNVLNICMYLLSIYIVSHEKFLSKIPITYVYVHRLLKFYKNIRISLILFEVILLIFVLSLMIGLSYGLLSYFFQSI